MQKWALFLCLALGAGAVPAETPEQIVERYVEMAKARDPAFAGFSAERGEKLYHEKGVIPGVGYVSCAGCHLDDPRLKIVAHKSKILCRACHVINDAEHPNPSKAKVRTIPPLAPAANPERLTDLAHVEEFLKVNCTTVFKRECTLLEKGDVLTWLKELK